MNAIALTLDQQDAVSRPLNTNRGCLALNASYEPLAVITVRRAVRLVMEERAEIVEVDGTRVIRSADLEFPFPAVIRLVRFVRVPRRFRRHVTNTFLHARDGYRCAFCGRHRREFRLREFLTRDHVIPHSRFPTKAKADTWENCVTACSTCNNTKANRTPEEAGMTLLIKPTVPHFVRLVWTVRRLTPLQRKYVARFFGDEVVETLDD